MEDHNLMFNEHGNKSNVINMIPFFKNCEHAYWICNYFKTEKINLEVNTQKVIIWLFVDFNYLPFG